MTFGERVKTLRHELGLSQETFGTRGFVSTPGWIKIENGQRQASEKLIEQLSKWLVGDKLMRVGAVGTLKEELLTLKYLGSPSTFVREMAKSHATKLPSSAVLLAGGKRAPRKVKSRGARTIGKPAKKR